MEEFEVFRLVVQNKTSFKLQKNFALNQVKLKSVWFVLPFPKQTDLIWGSALFLDYYLFKLTSEIISLQCFDFVYF